MDKNIKFFCPESSYTADDYDLFFTNLLTKYLSAGANS